MAELWRGHLRPSTRQSLGLKSEQSLSLTPLPAYIYDRSPGQSQRPSQRTWLQLSMEVCSTPPDSQTRPKLAYLLLPADWLESAGSEAGAVLSWRAPAQSDTPISLFCRPLELLGVAQMSPQASSDGE